MAPFVEGTKEASDEAAVTKAVACKGWWKGGWEVSLLVLDYCSGYIRPGLRALDKHMRTYQGGNSSRTPDNGRQPQAVTSQRSVEWTELPLQS